MLESDSIDSFEVLNTSKTIGSHECRVCYYSYFLKRKFKNQQLYVTAVINFNKNISSSMLLQLLLLEEITIESIFGGVTLKVRL